MTLVTLVSLWMLISVLATTTTTHAFAGVGTSFLAKQERQTTWSTTTTTTTTSRRDTSLFSFALLVEMEINPDRMEEFLEKIEFNAVNSRKEPQCQRFGELLTHTHTSTHTLTKSRIQKKKTCCGIKKIPTNSSFTRFTTPRRDWTFIGNKTISNNGRNFVTAMEWFHERVGNWMESL